MHGHSHCSPASSTYAIKQAGVPAAEMKIGQVDSRAVHVRGVCGINLLPAKHFSWVGEIFGHTRVKILVFPSPTGYMLWCFDFLEWLIGGIFYTDSSKSMGNFLEVLNINWLFLQTRLVHLYLHWIFVLLCVTIRSYAMLHLFNENVIFYQAKRPLMSLNVWTNLLRNCW